MFRDLKEVISLLANSLSELFFFFLNIGLFTSQFERKMGMREISKEIIFHLDFGKFGTNQPIKKTGPKNHSKRNFQTFKKGRQQNYLCILNFSKGNKSKKKKTFSLKNIEENKTWTHQKSFKLASSKTF